MFVLHLPIFDLVEKIQPQFIPALAIKGESAENTVHLILRTESPEQAKLWTLWFCVYHQIGTDDVDLLKVNACHCQLGVYLKPIPVYYSSFDPAVASKPVVVAYYWPKNEHLFHSERVTI